MSVSAFTRPRWAGLAILILALSGCGNPVVPNPDSPNSGPTGSLVGFDANGADGGTVPPSYGNPGQTVSVAGNNGGLVKTGFDFMGWNTRADGAGFQFRPGQQLSLDALPVTLFAMWSHLGAIHHVTYLPNGATGGTVPVDAHGYLAGEQSTVAGNTGGLTRMGFTFSGWNTKADGTGLPLAPDSEFTVGIIDVTLFARWTVPASTAGVTVDLSGLGNVTKVIYRFNGGTGSDMDQALAFEDTPAGTTSFFSDPALKGHTSFVHVDILVSAADEALPFPYVQKIYRFDTTPATNVTFPSGGGMVPLPSPRGSPWVALLQTEYDTVKMGHLKILRSYDPRHFYYTQIFSEQSHLISGLLINRTFWDDQGNADNFVGHTSNLDQHTLSGSARTEWLQSFFENSNFQGFERPLASVNSTIVVNNGLSSAVSFQFRWETVNGVFVPAADGFTE